jgi:hypothetical protein
MYKKPVINVCTANSKLFAVVPELDQVILIEEQSCVNFSRTNIKTGSCAGMYVIQKVLKIRTRCAFTFYTVTDTRVGETSPYLHFTNFGEFSNISKKAALDTGTDVMIFKNIFAEKFSEKIGTTSIDRPPIDRPPID